MYIKGKFKTEQNRILDFEFKTELLDGVKGNSTTWYDETYQIKSELKVNGNIINTYKVDNFINTQAFEKMYKNSVVTEITEYKLDNFDYESFDEIGQLIEYQESDFIDWFLEKYHYEGLSRGFLCYDFEWYIDEYIYTTDNFKVLINELYDLSNGYHNLSQWNDIINGLLEMLFNEYEEDQQEIA